MATSRYEVWCPDCGCQMRKRSGKFGEFFGCSGYPACKNTMSIRDGALQAVLEDDGSEERDDDET